MCILHPLRYNQKMAAPVSDTIDYLSPAGIQSYSRYTSQQGVQSDIPEMKRGYSFNRQSEMETVFRRRQKMGVLFQAQDQLWLSHFNFLGLIFFVCNTGITTLHWCGS